MAVGNSNQNMHCLLLKPVPPAPDFCAHSPPQSCTQGLLLVPLRSVKSFLSTPWSSLSKEKWTEKITEGQTISSSCFILICLKGD